jgi:hypothetical protein
VVNLFVGASDLFVRIGSNTIRDRVKTSQAKSAITGGLHKPMSEDGVKCREY